MNVPAYMKIRQYVIDLLRKHSDSEVRIMSERELCDKFGVTRPTARKALQALIEDGFLIVRQGSGTFINPAKTLNHAYVLRKSFTVMIVIAGGSNTDMDGFYMALLAEVFDCFKALPVQVRMINLNTSDAREAVDALQMHDLSGILWLQPDVRSRAIIKMMRKNMPVCVLGDAPCGCKGGVTTDYRAGGYLAGRWFAERGLTRAAFVGADSDSAIKEMIYAGWQKAFSEAGIDCKGELRIGMDENIRSKVKELLAQKATDGIFSFGSEFAAVDLALAESGEQARRCPVIIDENWYGGYAAATPIAAKVLFFPPEVARKAAEELFRAMNEDLPLPDEIVFLPRLLN